MAKPVTYTQTGLTEWNLNRKSSRFPTATAA